MTSTTKTLGDPAPSAKSAGATEQQEFARIYNPWFARTIAMLGAPPPTLAQVEAAEAATDQWARAQARTLRAPRAETLHDTGHMVADSVLRPACAPARCRLAHTVEPDHLRLKRLAVVTLAGPMAEGFGGGSLHYNAGELAIVAYISAVSGSSARTAIGITQLTASVLGQNWDIVQVVEELLHTRRDTREALNSVRSTMTTVGDRRYTAIKAALIHYADANLASLVALAVKLARLRRLL